MSISLLSKHLSVYEFCQACLGAPLPNIANNPAKVLPNPFHEHLFLKTLWTLKEDLATVIHTYLEKSTTWSTTQDYHPYELILFYRALLLHGQDPQTGSSIVRQVESLFERMDYGGTLGLIHSYIRVVFKRMQIGTASDAEFNDELNIVEGYLPAAKSQINTLRRAWEDPSIDISSVLPFNYK